MRRPLGLIVVVLLAGAEPPEDTAKKHLEQLQGQWIVQQAQRDGKDAPAEEREKMLIKIEGKKLVIDEPETAREQIAEITLDPSKSPSAIDLKIPRLNKGEVLQGIYKLDGDVLSLCWTRSGGARPSEFATKPGSDQVLFILKRPAKK
jgi:uncharacterized protein (TIGR03067 family)